MHRIFRDLLAPQVAEGRKKEMRLSLCGGSDPVVRAQSLEQELAPVPISSCAS